MSTLKKNSTKKKKKKKKNTTAQSLTYNPVYWRETFFLLFFLDFLSSSPT